MHYFLLSWRYAPLVQEYILCSKGKRYCQKCVNLLIGAVMTTAMSTPAAGCAAGVEFNSGK